MFPPPPSSTVNSFQVVFARGRVSVPTIWLGRVGCSCRGAGRRRDDAEHYLQASSNYWALHRSDLLFRIWRRLSNIPIMLINWLVWRQISFLGKIWCSSGALPRRYSKRHHPRQRPVSEAEGVFMDAFIHHESPDRSVISGAPPCSLELELDTDTVSFSIYINGS